MATISSSNTKAEILKAYDELVSELKEHRKENTTLRQEIEKKQSLIENATATVKAGAAVNIQQIRKVLDEQLEKLETALAEEQKKFEMLQEAVKTGADQLKNLHQIKAEAESLEALTIAHRQAKVHLEEELGKRKELLEANILEAKTKWEREEEEYQYNLKLKRRNEQDAYNEKKEKLEKEMADRKAAFEKNMADREHAVAEQEEELKRLRKEVEAFDGRLQKAVAEAEKAVSERLTREFEYKQKLEVKDLEAELKLREQMIHSLEGKIKEQQELVASLSAKTDSASQQVKDIAIKAIEKSGIVSVPMERRRDRDEKGND
ncbi:MAG: hypothetical protein H6577_22505 [Lewinellaceae bacterium]|nr:hypothetical protein [Saprospiraceae bacterium]MCB9340908.1 hypothetical protein [Lewinellaceae bacterium]